MPKFEFIEDVHTYLLDSRPIPSVTQILASVFGNQFWYDDWYANRGTALHLAIQYLNRGTLDINSVDPEIMGRLNAYERFLKETGLKIIDSEKSLYSTKYRYAGTIDLIMSGHNNQYIIGDIKSSVEPKADLQVAGYSLLYTEKPIKKLCSIELKSNGSYAMRWVDNIKLAQRTFLACLTVYNFKIKNKV